MAIAGVVASKRLEAGAAALSMNLWWRSDVHLGTLDTGNTFGARQEHLGEYCCYSQREIVTAARGWESLISNPNIGYGWCWRIRGIQENLVNET